MNAPEDSGSTRKPTGRWAWIAFFVLLVLPIYLVAVTVCIRSGLFHFAGGNLSADQYKALWSFLAAGLAAAATTLGALVAKAHNDRSFVLQTESEERQKVLGTDTNARLKMDTVINCLAVVCPGGQYAPKAAAAGGLAVLVQLGHPIIAMRTLSAALRDNAVDADTATWLIGQVLTSDTTMGSQMDLETAKSEGVAILGEHISILTWQELPGFYCWPSPLSGRWHPGLGPNTATNALYFLAQLLVSRPVAWWTADGNSYSWVLCTLDEAVQHEPNDEVKRFAANLALAIMQEDPTRRIAGPDGTRDRADVLRRMEPLSEDMHAYADLFDSIQAWCTAQPDPDLRRESADSPSSA